MIYIGVIAGVVAVLLTVTVWKAVTIRSEADFLVAGRKLPWTVLVFTLLCSWIGAGSLFAGAENAYTNGFPALWQPAGGWAGLIIISTIAARARRFAQFTVPDLLETRYNATARVLGTIAIVIAYVTITSYQLKAGGDIIHLIFPGIGREHAMYAIAAFVIAFTAGAGMASVAYLDLVIGALVTGILIASLPILLHSVGGWDEVRRLVPASHFTAVDTIGWERAFGLFFPTLLLLIGNQGMYQKFFSARSEKDAKMAVGGWIAGALVLETVIIALAVVASAKFHPANAREIIPTAARLGLPAVPGALLLGGIFAKLISTANNYLFSPATNIIHDVYQRFIDRNGSEKRYLLVSRLIVVLLGIYAVVQATQFESILNASLYAYTIYGAAITPAVMAVFFSRRVNTPGAISSIAGGTLVTVIWNMAGSPGGVDAIYPALGVSLLCLVVVSAVTAPPPKQKWAAFFEPAEAPKEAR